MSSNWKANLQEVFEDSGTSYARITWHNDVDLGKSQQDVPLIGIKDENVFNSILRNKRDNTLETSTELIKILTGKIGTDLDIEASIVVIIPLTDLQLFLISWNKLQSIKRKVDAGLIDISDSRFIAQLKETQTLIKDDSFLLVG